MAAFDRIPETPDVLSIPTPPQQAAALFIVFFFTAIAFIACSLRVWTRLRVTGRWGLDDTLIVPAEVLSLLMCPPFYLYVKLGYFGWRAEDVPSDVDPSPGLWWFYLSQIFYNPILALVKCSVLVFLLRLGSHAKAVRWSCYGLITFTGLQAVAIFFSVLFQCIPIEANWNLEAKAGAKCIDNAFHITISSITILTDILVVALPFYVFLGLKMRKATKIALICVFALGGVVTIISIIRIAGLIQLFYFPQVDAGDPYYDIKMTLSVVEVNTAIATACAPALRPLVRDVFPSVFGSNDETEAPSGYGGYGGGDSHGYPRKRGLSHSRRHSTTTQSAKANIALKSLKRGMDSPPPGHLEVRGTSPTGSEEAIMTYNGIIRTMDVQVQYAQADLQRKASRKGEKERW